MGPSVRITPMNSDSDRMVGTSKREQREDEDDVLRGHGAIGGQAQRADPPGWS